MRPVERGPEPPSAPFSKYREAIGPLTVQIGWYCSYCERRLEVSLAIEHVKPKGLNPGLALEWTNFLLGCTNCNSTKGSHNIQLDEYYWPDNDNTLLAFTYGQSGVVEVASNLTPAQTSIARSTLKLTGLDRQPGGPTEPTDSDRRWLFRREAFEKAEEVHAILQQHDIESIRNLIVKLAKATGYWSIWFTVFIEDDDMRQRLVNTLPGTSTASFDANARPIPRGAL